MIACQWGCKDVVKLLLLDHSDRIKLNARNNKSQTAFMIACLEGYKDIVKFFLDNSERIELNARSNNGNTAFMWACQYGRRDVVKLLSEAEIVDTEEVANDHNNEDSTNDTNDSPTDAFTENRGWCACGKHLLMK